MITKAVLSNFQCHSKKVITFTSGINVITGSSDTGKSAVLRAIRFALLNQGSVEGYIKHGEKKMFVSVVSDGKRIKRKRKGSSNLYYIGDKEFSAFSKDVPEEILQHHKMAEQNFQTQHEAPFWFGLSAGNVSKEINKLIDLQEIDTVLHRAISLMRECVAEEKIIKERITTYKESLKETRHVKRWKVVLVEAKEIFKSIKEANRRLEDIESALTHYEEYSHEISETEETIKRVNAEISVYSDEEAIENRKESRDKLVSLFTDWCDSCQENADVEK
jgi:exonuclease SbcC